MTGAGAPDGRMHARSPGLKAWASRQATANGRASCDQTGRDATPPLEEPPPSRCCRAADPFRRSAGRWRLRCCRAERGLRTLRRTRPRRRHGSLGPAARAERRLGRPGLRATPRDPGHARAAVLDRRRLDGFGGARLPPLIARRRAEGARPARLAHGALRQGQPHRPGRRAGPGPRQRRAPRAGDGAAAQGRRALAAGLSRARRRRQSFAREREALGAAASALGAASDASKPASCTSNASRSRPGATTC